MKGRTFKEYMPNFYCSGKGVMGLFLLCSIFLPIIIYYFCNYKKKKDIKSPNFKSTHTLTWKKCKFPIIKKGVELNFCSNWFFNFFLLFQLFVCSK